MKNFYTFTLLIVTSSFVSAQQAFTRKDSLQGSLRPERTCYDVQHYGLNIKIDPTRRSVVGFNDIDFKVVEKTKRIQVDLFDNMTVDSIVFDHKKLAYIREFNAVFIDFPTFLHEKSEAMIRFYYSGTPKSAPRAPWDGGFDWKKDEHGKDFVGVATQGTGASLWFPVKDSQTDEPDNGATIKIAVPNGLMDVSNGRFIGSEDLKNGFTRWDWEVKSPINNYDITVNIGDYAHIHENYKGLDLDYYVLRDFEAIARKHFEEVKPMMDCFQSKFGTYPFAEDGYKLVQTPYLGMEHQSAVAYGNGWTMGYLGNDMSGTGIGLTFDYITIHESAHEWFGNSITSKDIADMWIHEGFAMYAESVYVECTLGYDKAMKYLNGMKGMIGNDKPIIGKYGVNNEGSEDMYPKGAWILNTLRHIVNDDTKWWTMLKKYSETYRHQIIDTQALEHFFSEESGIDLTLFFDQYLRTIKIPELAFSEEGGKLFYQWKNVVPGFAMPVDITVKSTKLRLYPTEKRQQLKHAARQDIKVSDDFLAQSSGL
jgi:aminopeptidase N